MTLILQISNILCALKIHVGLEIKIIYCVWVHCLAVHHAGYIYKDRYFSIYQREIPFFAVLSLCTCVHKCVNVYVLKGGFNLYSSVKELIIGYTQVSSNVGIFTIFV